MATYENWAQVPAHIERKIRLMWQAIGTAIVEQTGARYVYKLADCKVLNNIDYLTDAQRMTLFNVAVEREIILSSLLHRLHFEQTTVTVASSPDEAYIVPGIVVGTWPHCDCYGGLDEDGRIHT